MKQLVLLLITLGAIAPVHAAPPRLIVRGDDMGAAHAINEAIMKCHKEGVQTSIEVIVPLIKLLESLEHDKTYLFVDHPGFDTPEMRAIHHIGYENVASDRQGVTDAWTSPRVQEAFKVRWIQLIGYWDLKN